MQPQGYAASFLPSIPNFLKFLGPSLVDSQNGEIISATTNIQLNTIFWNYEVDIRYYIRSQLGMQDLALRSTPFVSQVKSPLTLMNPLNLGSGLFGSSTVDFEVTVDQQGNIEKKAPSRYVLGPDGQRAVSRIEDELFSDPKQRAYLEVFNGGQPIQSYAEAVSVYRQSLATPGLQNQLLFEAQGSPNRSGLSPYVEQQIIASCPEVNEFVKKIKSTSQGIITSDEVAVIDQCSAKISRIFMLRVMEHELGHNLGLRHNFTCSNDSANFWTANEIRQMFSGLNGESFPEEFLPFGKDPVGSCVMDYYTNRHPLIPVPGKYDIAAIKFMYAGKVDLANGTTVSVALKTGDGEVQYRSLESISGLKPYKFCSDEDIALSVDPMCAHHDTGLTPEEVVSNLIEDYWQSLISRNYRYDRVFSSMNPDVIFARRQHILGQLKRFYDQWRFKLGEFVGQKDQYLESYDSKTYQDHVLSAMERSSLRNDYLAYKPVRDLISDFMIKLAFLPDKFCVGRTKTDYLVAIPLAQLRSEVALYQQGAEVDRCDSKGILELLSRRNVRFETEVGHGLKTTYYSSSPANLMRGQPDEIGTLIDHLLAIKLLSLRLDKGSLIHVAREFYPSMMDEPDIRGLILTKFLSRLSFGVDLSEDLKKVPQLANNPKVNQPFQVFSSDMGLFVPLMTSLKMGQMVPGKPDVNQIRMASFALKKVTPDSEVYNLSVKKGAAILPVPDGDVLLALPQNIFSYYLLNEVQRVQVNQVIGSGFSLDSPEIEKGISVLLEAFPDHDIEPFTLTNILDLLKKFAELKDKDDLASSHRIYLTQLFFGYSQAIGPKSSVFAAAKSLETKYIDNFQDRKGNGVKPTDPFAFLMGAVRQLGEAKVQLKAEKSQLEAQVKEIQAGHPGESALGPESEKERTELGKVSQRLDHAEKLLAQLEGDIRSVDLTDYLRENKLSTSKESFRSNYLVRFNAVVNMLRETAPPSEQQAQMDALKQLISN